MERKRCYQLVNVKIRHLNLHNFILLVNHCNIAPYYLIILLNLSQVYKLEEIIYMVKRSWNTLSPYNIRYFTLCIYNMIQLKERRDNRLQKKQLSERRER